MLQIARLSPLSSSQPPLYYCTCLSVKLNVLLIAAFGARLGPCLPEQRHAHQPCKGYLHLEQHIRAYHEANATLSKLPAESLRRISVASVERVMYPTLGRRTAQQPSKSTSPSRLQVQLFSPLVRRLHLYICLANAR